VPHTAVLFFHDHSCLKQAFLLSKETGLLLGYNPGDGLTYLHNGEHEIEHPAVLIEVADQHQAPDRGADRLVQEAFVVEMSAAAAFKLLQDKGRNELTRTCRRHFIKPGACQYKRHSPHT
jgi:hypothetical protein